MPTFKKISPCYKKTWSKGGTHSRDPGPPLLPRISRSPGPCDFQDPRDPLGTQDLRTSGKSLLTFDLQNLNIRRNLKTDAYKRKTSSLNHIIEWSQTQVENHVNLSEVLFIIQLLAIIIRGKSLPLLPCSYAAVINGNSNQRHLIGCTWNEKDFLKLYSM